jgi:Rps23 Pro-64 3,4-dihydroxylase Tpa1-like proline 4-hydroxylase
MKSFVGEWFTYKEVFTKIKNDYNSAVPFPFVVIPNFFKADVAEQIYSCFPKTEGTDANQFIKDGWCVYDNPIEGKLAMNNFEAINKHGAILTKIWDMLESDEFVTIISDVAGIENLEKDPHRHGAGLHSHPPNGRLDMHLDYSIHPITGKERRVNLLIYMNKDWQDDWNGNLELWKGDKSAMTNVSPVQSISPNFNQAVLFRTSDISWHGMPEPVKCPEGECRKSIAIYYVSESRGDGYIRKKALFQARPTDAIRDDQAKFEAYDKLCSIRVERILTREDIKELVPEWNPRWTK